MKNESNIYFRELADAELQTNIKESEIFTLPSGQEIEKDDILISWIICVHISIYLKFQLSLQFIHVKLHNIKTL